MPPSILDIKDEFKFLQKLVIEKKVKSEVIASAKKRLFEHLELKYHDYTASIAKIGKEVDSKMEETKQYVENMEEVKLLLQKELEYQTKKAQSEAAEFLGKPVPFSLMHMNKLEQEILELRIRCKPILGGRVDIELLSIQMGRWEWLANAIRDIRNLKQAIEKSNKKDTRFLNWYKLVQIISFVLSVYGVFQIVELLKPKLPINEFFLNVIAGVIVLLGVDSITNMIKQKMFEKYLENGLTSFNEVINEMRNVDNALSSYTF